MVVLQSRTRKKIVCVYVFLFFVFKTNLQELKFVRLSWGRTTEKLSINWKIFPKLDSNSSLHFRTRL